MSRISKSNPSLRLIWMASSPSSTTWVAYPRARNPFSMKDEIRLSSSAIKIRGIGRLLRDPIGRIDGQDHGERRTRTRPALELDATTVSHCDRLDDGEPEPSAPVAPVRPLATGEPLEHALGVVG